MFRKLLVLLLLPLSCSAQQIIAYENKADVYNKALELYDKQMYSAAKSEFEKCFVSSYGNQGFTKQNALYYTCLCSMTLFNTDAEALVNNFVSAYPDDIKSNELLFKLGVNMHDKKEYAKAVFYFEKVNKYLLPESDFPEYCFKAGYSCFCTDKNADARTYFYQIKDSASYYSAPALYYYSHINYADKNYETALKGFINLGSSDIFKAITPYYITYIYYNQGKYDSIIKYSPKLIDSVVDSRKAEFAKIIGDSYFMLNKYDSALKYLEIYRAENPVVTPLNRYMYAYVYYKNNDCKQAIDMLEKIPLDSSELCQYSLYIMAECYIKQGEKKKAHMALGSASRMNFNMNIKEDALFNYAKLTYETSYNPFNESIKAFQEYLDVYPLSNRKDKVYNMLVNAYMNTRNYKDALVSLDNIIYLNDEMKKAYQHISFYSALEEFTNMNYNEALFMLNKSIAVGEYNPVINARARFWRAETYYRLSLYSDAINDYNTFITLPGAMNTAEYLQALYGLAYCYFNKQNYEISLSWFRRFTGNTPEVPDKMFADAFNRTGDIFFKLSKYTQAIDNYQKAIDINLVDVDYALLQKGISHGVIEQHQQKIKTLNKLLSDFPNSNYTDDAIYELGKAYIEISESNKAIAQFTTIINTYKESGYYRKSLNKLGALYYNTGDNAKAIMFYKKTIAEFPATDESADALNGLKVIYLDNNNINEYFNYLNVLGQNTLVPDAQRDSLTFQEVEQIYMQENCDSSITKLDNYIKSFPQGLFSLNAHFYRGECYHQMGNTDSTLSDMIYVIEKPFSVFTEQALVYCSNIYYYKQLYDSALNNYIRLESLAEVNTNRAAAILGQFRCYYLLQKYNSVIRASEWLFNSDKLSKEQEQEIRFKLAKSYIAVDSIDLAEKELLKVSENTSTAEGAEAKYMLADLLYKKGMTSKSMDIIFEYAEMNTPHQYWLAKSFLLLADIFVELKDDFQATHTLQSLIDNYDNSDDEIIQLAKEKQKEITERQNAANEPVETPALEEIQIDENEK